MALDNLISQPRVFTVFVGSISLVKHKYKVANLFREIKYIFDGPENPWVLANAEQTNNPRMLYMPRPN